MIVVLWVVTCLCLFEAIVELHAMDGIMFNDFLIGKWTWILYVMKTNLIHELYILYVED